MYFLVTVTDLANMPYEELVHFVAKAESLEEVQEMVTGDTWLLDTIGEVYPGVTNERANIVVYPLNLLEDIYKELDKSRDNCYIILSDVHKHICKPMQVLDKELEEEDGTISTEA